MNSVGASIVLQEAVGRNDSLRIKISDSVWAGTGLGTFSVERIPYSSMTGHIFAKKMVKTFLARIRNIVNSGKQAHLYEFGVGTGILSKNILDFMAEEHPEEYANIIIHISDISEESIASIQSLNLFQHHHGHVIFEVMDAASPAYTVKPDIIYHSYLLDSLPTNHFEVSESGEIFEICIRSEIPADASIVDVSQFPPVVLKANEIAELYTNDDLQRQLLLANQLLDILHEKQILVPVESRGYSGEDLECLTAFAETVKSPEKKFSKETEAFLATLGNKAVKYSKQFNYSFIHARIMREAINALGDNGLIFISDYGKKTIDQRVRQYTRYGNTSPAPVSFPVVQFLAEYFGAQSILTTHVEDGPQQILISPRFSDEVQQNFISEFSLHGGERVVRFFQDIDRLAYVPQQERLLASMQLFEALPADYQVDLECVIKISQFLINNGFYTETLTITELAMQDYGHVATQLHILQGLSLLHLGQTDKAEKCFKQAMTIAPALAMGYKYMADLYDSLKQKKKAIGARECYLRYSREGDFMQTLWQIARAEKASGNDDSYEELVLAIKTLGENLQALSIDEAEILQQVMQSA